MGDSEGATYTVEETAKLLRISKAHCYEMCRSGKIPCLRLGRRILVPVAALDRRLRRTAA